MHSKTTFTIHLDDNRTLVIKGEFNLFDYLRESSVKPAFQLIDYLVQGSVKVISVELKNTPAGSFSKSMASFDNLNNDLEKEDAA